MVSRTIKEQITSQEPRVTEVQVTFEAGPREGVLLFNIEYVVQNTNTRDNLVFPFYLDVASEQEEEGEPEIYEPTAVEEIGN